MWGGLELSPLARYHHVDLTAAAPGTPEPIAPGEHAGLGAVPVGHLGRIGLDLMPTCPAPNDQPHAGRGGVAEVIGGPGSDFT
jgi:hypothetical protein